MQPTGSKTATVCISDQSQRAEVLGVALQKTRGLIVSDLEGYPEISGSLARQKASQLRDDASTGKNPLVSKQSPKIACRVTADNTVEALGREGFDARRSSWEAGTPRRVLGAQEHHVFPVFGKRIYTEILPLNRWSFCAIWSRKGLLNKSAEFALSAKKYTTWHA